MNAWQINYACGWCPVYSDTWELYLLLIMKFCLLVTGVSLLVLAVPKAQSMSSGPPLNSGTFTRICDEMTPNHGSAAQSGNGGYAITTDIPRSGSTGYSYTAGQTYTGNFN